jgi:hypothetical protein
MNSAYQSRGKQVKASQGYGSSTPRTWDPTSNLVVLWNILNKILCAKNLCQKRLCLCVFWLAVGPRCGFL